jgi:hypothetical protein
MIFERDRVARFSNNVFPVCSSPLNSRKCVDHELACSQIPDSNIPTCNRPPTSLAINLNEQRSMIMIVHGLGDVDGVRRRSCADSSSFEAIYLVRTKESRFRQLSLGWTGAQLKDLNASARRFETCIIT